MAATTKLLPIGLLMLLGAGCSADRTMLVVRVESNIVVPDAMNFVRVVVTHAGKPLQSLPFSLGPGTPAAGTHVLPLQVGLLSPSGGGADVEITVTGSLGQAFVVSQDAVTSFVKDKSLVLDMFLAAECVSFDCHDPNKTCTKGQVCVPVMRAADSLPPFEPHPPNPPSDGSGGGDAKDGDVGSDAGDTASSNDGAGGASDAVDVRADVGTMEVSAEVAPEVPACVPKTEDCFNGLDDDCDGLPDCADPDCAPTAVCVPRPSGDVGTSVPGGQGCPAGFASPTMLSTGLQGGGASCTGCQCGQSTTSCSATLTSFVAAADCQVGANQRPVTTITYGSPDPCPVPDQNTPQVYGAALSAWNVGSTPCGASGAPVKPTPTFTTSTTFCRADRVSAVGKTGCAAGSVCMPKAASGGTCVLLADAGMCPTGTKAGAVLYSGFADNRACAACTCAAAVASCDNLVLQMGSDYSCGVDEADIHGGARTCTTQVGGVYTPGYHLVGAPAPGICKPQSAVTGTLTPTGGRALCCLP